MCTFYNVSLGWRGEEHLTTKKERYRVKSQSGFSLTCTQTHAITPGSQAQAFRNVSKNLCPSKLGSNCQPRPLCSVKQQGCLSCSTSVFFKPSLCSCLGCRSWSWLHPADWKGWLPAQYVPSLLPGRLSETLLYSWVCMSFISGIASYVKVPDLRSWHLLTRSPSEKKQWVIISFVHII